MNQQILDVLKKNTSEHRKRSTQKYFLRMRTLWGTDNYYKIKKYDCYNTKNDSNSQQ